MDRLTIINQLIAMLLKEMPEHKDAANSFDYDITNRRKLLRALMNLSSPKTMDENFFHLQDTLLQEELKEKAIGSIDDLKELDSNKIALWQGDICTLKVDAIVNAANSELLGCFHPLHNCIDNAIHSAAGLQLRDECFEIMSKKALPEGTGKAEITSAYNLPSKYVIHTVGPIVFPKLLEKHKEELKSSYLSCLNLAEEKSLKTIAFCCISTGEYRFPQREAAEIAVNTVKSFLKTSKSIEKVIFNVFKEEDFNIYNCLI